MYENIVAKSKDFIGYVTYSYFNKDKSDKIRPKDNNANEIFKPIDLKSYGRCYTAQPTKEMMNYGIRKVSIIVWARSLIFFHNPGMLTSARQRDFIDINLGRKFNIGLDYEVFHMLDFGGGECNHDPDYDLDLCAHKDLLQVCLSTLHM